MTDDTVALLTEAAELAEEAAMAATNIAWEVVLRDRVQAAEWSSEVVDGTTYQWKRFIADCDSSMEESPDPDADQANARLIAASGPDHWRAVAAMLRRSVDLLRALGDVGKVGVGYSFLDQLRPLAELIVQQLGGTE